MAVYNVVFTEEAETDLLQTIAHYDAEPTSDLSDRFLLELDAAVEKLAAQPEHYSFYQDTGLRACSLQRFRFILLYEVIGKTVVVYSVRHTSRQSFNK